jgi:hypothetical protein
MAAALPIPETVIEAAAADPSLPMIVLLMIGDASPHNLYHDSAVTVY